mmetsp:Transcript_121980/g.182137  ORF Transcript_121980/g.182137 Transcript_121980/m.182137 type:complete len:113 (+) Transcript_121980:154-492(+)
MSDEGAGEEEEEGGGRTEGEAAGRLAVEEEESARRGRGSKERGGARRSSVEGGGREGESEGWKERNRQKERNKTARGTRPLGVAYTVDGRVIEVPIDARRGRVAKICSSDFQ